MTREQVFYRTEDELNEALDKAADEIRRAKGPDVIGNVAFWGLIAALVFLLGADWVFGWNLRHELVPGIDLAKPVVAAVHGYCIGSGLEIALLSDLRIGAGGTVFAMPEVQLGMIPAAAGTQTLPRNAGSSEALELLLTGRRFDAQEALRLGLLTRVVPAENLLDAAWQAASHLASLDADVVAAVKTALDSGADLPLPDALRLEAKLAARLLKQHSSVISGDEG